MKNWEKLDAESFSAEGVNYECLQNGKTYSRYRTKEMNTLYGPYPYKACYNCYTLKCTKALNPKMWGKRDKKAESFSAEEPLILIDEQPYTASLRFETVDDVDYLGVAHNKKELKKLEKLAKECYEEDKEKGIESSYVLEYEPYCTHAAKDYSDCSECEGDYDIEERYLFAESHAYSYAYNEGHSDSRKREEYRPNLTSARQEGDFKKILKQKGD